MGTLVQKTPQNEFLNGVWHSVDLNTGEISESIAFKYRNYRQDTQEEIQPMVGVQLQKVTNMIYTSSPITPKAGDRFDLEDQFNRRKAKIIDPVRSKNSDLRMKNVRDRMRYLPKIITFE